MEEGLDLRVRPRIGGPGSWGAGLLLHCTAMSGRSRGLHLNPGRPMHNKPHLDHTVCGEDTLSLTDYTEYIETE